MNYKIKPGFSLAEVLITLGVIGVVAVLTLPAVISDFKKRTVETKLKQNYSLLVQAVKMSEAQNDTIENWDYNLTAGEFTQKYILPYVKTKQTQYTSQIYGLGLGTNTVSIFLTNDSMWTVRVVGNTSNYAMIIIGIDGIKGKNQGGKDLFYFSILPKAKSNYNCGWGDFAKNIEKPGIYYDGYGYGQNNNWNTYKWRGCAVENTLTNRAFCTALIVENGWEIPNDYPIKF